MFKLIMFKLGIFLAARLPRSVAFQLGIFLCDLHYLFSFRDRRAVKNNLRIIFKSEYNLPQLTREVFRNFGKYLVEFFRMAQDVDLAYIKEKVEVEHLDYIDEALKKGNGAILMTAHIGNWEMGGVFLSLLGYPATAIALPHKERPVNDLFNHQREVKGITVVPMNTSVRKCLETLRKNGLIAILADRDFSNHGEVMDFLGRKALIPKGAAIFSMKTGAPIVPVFIIRKEDNGFHLKIQEPIYPKEVTDGIIEDKDLVEYMKKYTSVVESNILQYPTQWLMFREFWIK